MRHWLIDTDTGSDDAVALIMALRDDSVRVETITTVAGNVPLDLATRNARISTQVADTYAPPVHVGAGKPLLRPLRTAESVHGEDGLGNMNLSDPTLPIAEGHAVDAIIATAERFAGELEIVTLGPLTNLALACAKAPQLAQQLKHVWVMGGAGLGPGNVTPVAEFNMWVDAEAAQMVVQSGLALTFVGWDCSTDETFLSAEDLERLLATGSPIAEFCVRCNAVLQQYNLESWGKVGIDLPDPVTVAAALYPEMMNETLEAFVSVDYHSAATYGQLLIDQNGLLKQAPNARVCTQVDATGFKELLLRLVR